MAKVKKLVIKAATPLVLIRTYSAGVHIGKLLHRNGMEVTLGEARRLWRWRGANTLNEVTTKGVDTTWSRLSEPIDQILLLEAIEILPVAAAAEASLTVSRWPA